MNIILLFHILRSRCPVLSPHINLSCIFVSPAIKVIAQGSIYIWDFFTDFPYEKNMQNCDVLGGLVEMLVTNQGCYL